MSKEQLIGVLAIVPADLVSFYEYLHKTAEEDADAPMDKWIFDNLAHWNYMDPFFVDKVDELVTKNVISSTTRDNIFE